MVASNLLCLRITHFAATLKSSNIDLQNQASDLPERRQFFVCEPADWVKQAFRARRADMSSSNSKDTIWNFLWARRKYWKGPIIIMMVIVGILFAVAIVARIVPFISAML
jgi:hypothetical protein